MDEARSRTSRAGALRSQMASAHAKTRPGSKNRGEVLHPVRRHLRFEKWFPHIPLGLAVAPLGVLLVDSAVRTANGGLTPTGRVAELAKRADEIGLGALSEFGAGSLLLLMSIGLMLRSKVAWWSVILGLSALTATRFLLTSGAPNQLVGPYVGTLLVLLVLTRKAFPRRSLATPALLASFALATLFAYMTLVTLQLGEHFAPPVRDFPTALYFVVVTVSSVGYGEIVPNDEESRRFVMWLIVSGLAVGATLLSTVIVPVVTSRVGALLVAREEPVDRSNHYVVAGDSALARNTIEELEKRGERITLILSKAIDQEFYRKHDVIVGDPTDLSVLRVAGTENARGVLALSTDDAENGFVVLGVNELAPSVRTVAAVNDPKNESRLRRTQPSLLLSLQVLGGQLLAKALTGEQVEADMLDQVLTLHSDAEPDPPA